MRYIQNTQPNPPTSKEKDPKPVEKFGGKDGKRDYSGLYDAKKIPTKGGYK